jgi:hypothetical protein
VSVVLLSGDYARICAWREREARDTADARAGAPEGTEHTPGTPKTPDATHERR